MFEAHEDLGESPAFLPQPQIIPSAPSIHEIEPVRLPLLPTLEPWFLDMEKDTDMINMVEKLEIRKLKNSESEDYESGSVLGELLIATHRDERHVVVHIGARNMACLTYHKMCTTGLIALNYEILSDIRLETSCHECNSKKALLAIYLLGNTYLRDRIMGDEEVSKFEDRLFFSFEDMADCISECGNVLLLRKLAREGKAQTINLKCMIINGQICDCTYTVSEPATILFGGKSLEVVKIVREVKCTDEYVATMTAYFTRHGLMVRNHWSDSNYFITADPRTRFPVEPPFDICSRLPLRYMFKEYEVTRSFYQDKIGQHITDSNTYLSDNPEIISTLSSLLQMVIINQPEDPVRYLMNNYKQIYHEY